MGRAFSSVGTCAGAARSREVASRHEQALEAVELELSPRCSSLLRSMGSRVRERPSSAIVAAGYLYWIEPRVEDYVQLVNPRATRLDLPWCRLMRAHGTL
ncbi:hypothetical protein PHYPSEUDO_007651 [Phytophthora pseudosyringae]|uniref:Uncharacterized protein n=1 Tax=Phytophthora pseudosyringae TaxID=221518 RepID=A0A8T1VFX1_9STRA|nr:hypothetical protein PHYPSEUDO_007651 [Phytophthora pseudosyringae]